MKLIFSSALLLWTLAAGCGQKEEQASSQQPAHSLVIVRLPAEAGMDQLGQAEVRAVQVPVDGEQDGTALEALFDNAQPVSVAESLSSDAGDEGSTEASRRNHGYNRHGNHGYRGGYGYNNWNWGRGYRSIYGGPYTYNYSRPYGCGGYNYYPYYPNNCGRSSCYY